MIVNLNKNTFYTIYKIDGGNIVVNGSESGELSTSNVNESVEDKKAISIADEQIELHDGKSLKRIRDKIIIA